MKKSITTILHDFSASWLKAVGLLLLLMLSFSPPLLAQNRPVKFERLSLDRASDKTK